MSRDELRTKIELASEACKDGKNITEITVLVDGAIAFAEEIAGVDETLATLRNVRSELGEGRKKEPCKMLSSLLGEEEE